MSSLSSACLANPLPTAQGITGDVLALLDARALADLGVVSLGHRLGILRAVWNLKMEQGVEVGADDWRPNGAWLLCPCCIKSS